MGSNYPGRKEQNYQNNQNSNSKTYNREEIEFPTSADYRESVSPYAEGMDVRERRVITHAKKSNTKTIVLICVLVELIVVLTVAAIFLLDKKEDEVVPENTEVQPMETTKIARFTTFNSGYNYSNLPGLISSTETSDEEFLEMKNFISDYNSAWLKFVNYDDSSIYNYLRVGTSAYQKANNFNKKGLTEEFVAFEINDVRKNGNTYYVWSHEIINKYSSKGTKRAEYHWIYIVEEDSNGHYVERYEKDPYYK